MGIVIPFAVVKQIKFAASAKPLSAASDVEHATVESMRAAPDQRAVMAAARPLLDQCRDRYGFIVMQDGLPSDPAILGRALLALFHGLSALDREMAAPRTYPTFGVYFGRSHLTWFEDGYGGTVGLAVTDSVDATDIAAFVRPRIAGVRLRFGP